MRSDLQVVLDFVEKCIDYGLSDMNGKGFKVEGVTLRKWKGGCLKQRERSIVIGELYDCIYDNACGDLWNFGKQQ